MENVNATYERYREEVFQYIYNNSEDCQDGVLALKVGHPDTENALICGMAEIDTTEDWKIDLITEFWKAKGMLFLEFLNQHGSLG